MESVKGYNLYGLKINTPQNLRDFKEKKVYLNPDVVISYEKVEKPEKDLKDTVYHAFTIYNERFYYQEIPTVAKIIIEGNKYVRIERLIDQDEEMLNLFFIDSVFPVILMKNDLFPLRASAVQNEKGIYLITSRRGLGKSTLAAYLTLSGFKFVADNLCVLKWDKKKDQFVTKCYNPMVSVWRDVMPIFGKSNFPVRKVRSGLKKFDIDFSKEIAKSYTAVVGIIYLKHLNLDQPPQVEILNGFDKLEIIKKAIHFHRKAAVVDQHKGMFKFSAKLASAIDIYRITRSKLISVRDTTTKLNEKVFTKTT